MQQWGPRQAAQQLLRDADMRRALASLLLRWARRLDDEPVEPREEEATLSKLPHGAGGIQESAPAEAVEDDWIEIARMRARALGVIETSATPMQVFALQAGENQAVSPRVAGEELGAQGLSVLANAGLSNIQGSMDAADDETPGEIAVGDSRRQGIGIALDSVGTEDLTRLTPQPETENTDACEPRVGHNSVQPSSTGPRNSTAIRQSTVAVPSGLSARDAAGQSTEDLARASGTSPSSGIADPERSITRNLKPRIDGDGVSKPIRNVQCESENERDDAFRARPAMGSPPIAVRSDGASAPGTPRTPAFHAQPLSENNAKVRDANWRSVAGARATPEARFSSAIRQSPINAGITSTHGSMQHADGRQDRVARAGSRSDTRPSRVSQPQARGLPDEEAELAFNAPVIPNIPAKVAREPDPGVIRRSQPPATDACGEHTNSPIDAFVRERAFRVEHPVIQTHDSVDRSAFVRDRTSKRVVPHHAEPVSPSFWSRPNATLSASLWPALPDEAGAFLTEDATNWPALPDELAAQGNEPLRPMPATDSSHIAFLLAEQRGERWNA